jgi:hypothetical protein
MTVFTSMPLDAVAPGRYNKLTWIDWIRLKDADDDGK